MAAVQPQPPGPVSPHRPSGGLVPPLGPPQQVSGAARALALVAGLALLALLTVWGGYQLADKDLSKFQALPYLAPAIAAMVAVLFTWTGQVWKLRSDGRVLEGVGVLGRQGIDLAALTAVAGAQARGSTSLVLRTPDARLTCTEGVLRAAGPQVLDVIGRAVWAGQEQGRFVVPVLAAGIWGMPVRPGAPKTGRAGSTGPALAVVGVFLVATVVGVVLGMD